MYGFHNILGCQFVLQMKMDFFFHIYCKLIDVFDELKRIDQTCVCLRVRV